MRRLGAGALKTMHAVAKMNGDAIRAELVVTVVTLAARDGRVDAMQAVIATMKKPGHGPGFSVVRLRKPAPQKSYRYPA